jgi:hypothetical protein
MTIFCPSNLHRDKAPRRRILEAKFPEPDGGCNVERSRMRRAIHDTVSNVIHDRAEQPVKA